MSDAAVAEQEKQEGSHNLSQNASEDGAGQGTAGSEEAAAPEYDYPATIVDEGPCAKKITIEVPQDRIESSIKSELMQLRPEAQVPGFRVGHVPMALLEKRFAKEVREQVGSTLVRESFQSVIEKHKIVPVGEPRFEHTEQLKIPTTGSLTYTFSVDLRPTFDLPDFSSITLKKPAINVTDEHVAKAMQNLREQQGTLLPIEDRGAKEGDIVTAKLVLRVDGQTLNEEADQQVKVVPGRLLGIAVEDLPAQLADLKAGEKRTVKATIREGFRDSNLVGKEAEIDVEATDLRELELATIDADFLKQLEFDNEDDLKKALRVEMEERLEADIRYALRAQVSEALITQVQMDLPEHMSTRQKEVIVRRRVKELLEKQVPDIDYLKTLETTLEDVKSQANEDAPKELKLQFILQKIIEQEKIEVDEAELNGRIAEIAAYQGQRPGDLKKRLSENGSLQEMYTRMSEQKAMDKVISMAQIVEVADLSEALAEETPPQGSAEASASDAGDGKSETDSGSDENKADSGNASDAT